ncbi:MAG TPA: RNA methyltransferase [Thermomicrobiales bacterium]|nr:RNA methyltransferase [Thermomicrobiales bacterium]
MPPETIIRSRQNPIYKQLRSLLRRDRRHQERAFLVEGPRFIADAQRFGAFPDVLVLSESFADSLDVAPEVLHAARIFGDELFSSISDTVTSQGMIGVFPFPEFAPSADGVPFLLVVDGIQDPGNLGTLIRSAAAAGVTRVIALPGTADPWSPKTVRAATAAHFLIPIDTLSFESFVELLPNGISVVAADASGATRYDEANLRGPLALVVGSEGSGLSGELQEMAGQLVSIPLANSVESLNAGVAGSILLFEASRQRRESGKSSQKPNV